MPYIRQAMEKEPLSGICVKDSIYKSGFFSNFPFRNRVFPGCPEIWKVNQLYKSFKEINTLSAQFKENRVEAFYCSFRKDTSRRRQAFQEITQRTKINLEFDESIQGEVYLSNREKDWADKRFDRPFCFFHTQAASPLKSVIPDKLEKYIDPENLTVFQPPRTDNINLNFAVQMASKKNIVVDSIYLHSAAAMRKNVDVLFVSATVKRFFHTLRPRNITIKKIIYGNLLDTLKASIYYSHWQKGSKR